MCDKTQSVSVFTALSLVFIFFISIFSIANNNGSLASSKYSDGHGNAGKIMYAIFFIIFSLTFLIYFGKTHIFRLIISVFIKIKRKEIKSFIEDYYNDRHDHNYDIDVNKVFNNLSKYETICELDGFLDDLLKDILNTINEKEEEEEEEGDGQKQGEGEEEEKEVEKNNSSEIEKIKETLKNIQKTINKKIKKASPMTEEDIKDKKNRKTEFKTVLEELNDDIQNEKQINALKILIEFEQRLIEPLRVDIKKIINELQITKSENKNALNQIVDDQIKEIQKNIKEKSKEYKEERKRKYETFFNKIKSQDNPDFVENKEELKELIKEEGLTKLFRIDIKKIINDLNTTSNKKKLLKSLVDEITKDTENILEKASNVAVNTSNSGITSTTQMLTPGLTTGRMIEGTGKVAVNWAADTRVGKAVGEAVGNVVDKGKAAYASRRPEK